ncbi:hypothetical protein HAX54_043835 [Datura stramonium]|uniref:Uncharacterized protein n=1 Tax=Datura stramonium TaxID=4076 RepID=A0ABS8SNU4_DATST|nr:hypothetical protein [Datura stramonium]
MKATKSETSNEESEGEDGKNDNLALMDRSDSDSNSDSTEVIPDDGWMTTVLRDILVNFFPPTDCEYLCMHEKMGTHVESREHGKSNPSLSSSMEIAPSSVSPEEESTGSLSPTSSASIDLSNLISDIQNRYDPHDSVPKSPSPISSSSADSASISAASDNPPDNVSLFDSKSEEDLVPIAALKKGA